MIKAMCVNQLMINESFTVFAYARKLLEVIKSLMFLNKEKSTPPPKKKAVPLIISTKSYVCESVDDRHSDVHISTDFLDGSKQLQHVCLVQVADTAYPETVGIQHFARVNH